MAIVIEKQPDVLTASRNRLYFVISSDNAIYSSCELTARIVVEESGGTLSDLPVMKLYATGNGRSDLDVSKIIDRRMQPKFPRLASSGAVKLTGFTLRFKVIFKESYKGVSSEKTSEWITVVKGKFPEKQTVAGFVQEKNYLTNSGSVVEMVAEGVHYLTALFLAKGNFTVQLKAVAEDGNLIARPMGAISVTEVNQVYAIAVGMKHLVFDRPVRQYTIWVESGSGGKVLKEVTFRVRSMAKKYRPMVYLNVLGGIDAVVVTDMSETMKTERESYRADGLRLVSELTDYSDIFEATTGYISAESARLLRELVISDQVYVVHGDNLMGVNIEKGSYKLFTEDADLQAVTLKYSYAEQDYPVLNDDSGGVSPEPDPGPDPDPDPEPGRVVACCPDGVDDYLTITNPSALNLMQIAPLTSGMKRIYTIDMLPNLGQCFSIGRKNLFYLGFIFVGKGLIIQTYNGTKSTLVFQETVADYRDRRVTVEFGVENAGGELLLSLKLNGEPEILNPFVSDDFYIPDSDFFQLFNNGLPNALYGSSKVISFAIDAGSGDGAITRPVLWNFSESTPLVNRVPGKSVFDLVAHNVSDMNEFIKEVTFNL